MANEGTVRQLGPYRLIRKLGEGGMGAVYLADDPANGRKVALKVLPTSASANDEFVKRFRREAEAVTQLRHPCIVAGYGAGEDRGTHYYAMEYCDGEPLDQILKREKRVPPTRAIEIVIAVVKGLQHAHDKGIIHRDVKPSNVFVAKDGSIRILDLGLSKNLAEAERSFATVTGAVLGTPHYISPEQAQGDKGIDGRTDIYSLGAMFYHLLTGQTPFDGASAVEIMYKHVHGEMPNPHELREGIPEGYVHVLRRMMAKNPADRYADCRELVADLKELILGGTPKSLLLDSKKSTVAALRKRVAPKHLPAVTGAPPASKAKSPILWIAVGAGVLVAGLFALWPSAPEKTSKAPDPPPKRVDPPPKRPEPPENPEAAWKRKVAGLHPDEQVRAVLDRLRELNPLFDGQVRHEVANGKVVFLEFNSRFVTDLSPLAALPDLESLLAIADNQGGGALSDLSVLQGLKSLKVLSIHGGAVSDLSPLRGLKLVELYAGYTKITDLSPLEGMPLRLLALQATSVRSIAAVRSMPLRMFYVMGSGVTDLSPIRDMEIEDLSATLDPARDRSVLKSLRRLAKINGEPAAQWWSRNP